MTVIVGVIAPVLQTPPTFPESTTLPPMQNVTALFAVIIEAVGCMATFTILVFSSILPPVDSPLPISVAPFNKLMAPLATTVPLKTEKSPKSNLPLTRQNTLHKEAELMSVTLEKVLVAKAPPILIINTELGLFCPSKIKLPFNVLAAPVQ